MGEDLAARRLRALDSLINVVFEFNDAVGAVVRDVALQANVPLFLMAWLDLEGEKRIGDVETTLVALGVEPFEALRFLEDRRLIARHGRGGSSESEEACLTLTDAGVQLIRHAARAFESRVRLIGAEIAELADLVDA